MSFTSKASQHQAEQTVNKLFADILHTQPRATTTRSTTTTTPKAAKDRDAKLSSTQILTNQLMQGSKPASTARSKQQQKRKLHQKIKKKEAQDKKFQKFIKYNQILSKLPSSRTDAERAYINKLIRKNTNQLKQLSHIDDFEIESELEAVKLQLLNELHHHPTLKSRIRKKLTVPKQKSSATDEEGLTKQDFIDFDDKVKRGLISVPGLTPGLAPVDENESESDSE